jgi:nitrite reductase (NADH) small subunit
MTKTVCVAKLADITAGSSLSVDADGIGVALFNVGGKIYALDNTCPHAGGPLGEGYLEGDVVVCPWHGLEYHVPTGRCLAYPNITLRSYEVIVEDGEVKVRL